jgi:hypothetical protein
VPDEHGAMLYRLIAATAIAILFATPSPAQTPGAPLARVVEGTVVDAESRVPMAGATVTVGAARATTDAAGRFTLQVPAGQVEVQVTASGHFSLTTTLDVRAADATGTELALARETAFSATVDVVGSLPAAPPATQVVQPAQVLRTPGALDNVFRTLQTLPGVAATEEFGSRLSVRGGSPDQNLTVMDGVEIHDPFRLFGLTSAFNPEIIQRFELSSGGFGVQRGDRLSSLLLVENRDGRRDRPLAGSAALSITDANVVLEGALPGGATGSWLVTGRRTYYDVVASKVTGQDFPHFGDVQAKGVWEPGAGKKVTLFALRSRQAAALEIDEASASGEFQDDTQNDLAWARFDAAIGSRGQSHTVAAYSDTRSTFGVDAAFENTSQRSNSPAADAFGVANVVFERTLGVEDFSVRQELSWALGTHVIEAGGEAHRLSTSLRFEITGDRNPVATNGSSVQGGAGLPDLLNSTRNSTRGGAWFQDTWKPGPRGSVQVGVRLDRAGITKETLFSPRISAVLDVGATTRLKVGLGRYTQSPGYEKQVQSDYVLDFTSDAARALESERAVQASTTLERELGRGAILRVEAYYKRFTKVLIGQLEPEAERVARVARYDFPSVLASSVPADPIITTVPTNDGSGRAYGFDVFVARESAPADARVNGWASYTWGKAERDAYGRRYPFEYDRRHAFTLVGSYRLSTRWELAATTRLASGFPRTAPVGLRVAGQEDRDDRDGDGIIDEVLPARDADGLPVYAVNFGSVRDLNQARLPLFCPGGRPRDVAAAWRRRSLGALRRGHQRAEPQERRRPRATARIRPGGRPPAHHRAARSGDSTPAHDRTPIQVLAGLRPREGLGPL